jgi:methionyl-tRNA formyltransferase
MNIFVITDNKWWLEKAIYLFKKKSVSVDFYCSPKGAKLFTLELKSGLINVLDVNDECKNLISKYDLGFSCHCKQIFPQKLVESIRCINIHPGLNPYNRGWFPQVFSILNKKPIGATIHLMDFEVDHGLILYQQEVEVFDWDTSKSIYDRVLNIEFELFRKNFDSLIQAEYEKKEIPPEGNYNSIQDYNSLLEIDLNRTLTMREAIDYLRAMTHPPYKNSYFKGGGGRKIYVSLNIEKGSARYAKRDK